MFISKANSKFFQQKFALSRAARAEYTCHCGYLIAPPRFLEGPLNKTELIAINKRKTIESCPAR